VLEAKNEVEMN